MTNTFLEINELRFPIAIDTPVKYPEERGLKEVSQTGKTLRLILKRVNRFTVQTNHLTPKEADMYFNLVKGNGHFYSFSSDMWSSKGLSPDPFPTDYNYVSGHHSTALQIVTGELGILLPLKGDWTVSFWHVDTTDVHYLVDSEGRELANGSSSALPTGVSVIDKVFKAENITISDVIVLESLVTDEFIQSRINSTFSFSSLPRLKLTGVPFNGIEIYEGKITNTDSEAFGRDGVFYSDGRLLYAEFEQV